MDTPVTVDYSRMTVDPFRSESYPLTAITLLLTEQCNLRCDYCYISKAPRRMSSAVARRSVDFLLEKADRQSKKLAICFFGGEPLLEPQLLESTAGYATEKAQQAGIDISFSITSNATLLDQERYKILQTFKVKPTFSLDGIGACHDVHRKTVDGKGSFGLIERNIDRMLSLSGTTIRLTVTPETADKLYESVHWLVQKGFTRISISAVYEARWCIKSLSAYYDGWKRIYEYQKKLIKEGATAYRITNIMKSEQRLGSPGKPEWGCGAARNMVTIDAQGTLYPCHRFIGYFNSGKEQQIGHVLTGFNDRQREYYIASNSIQSHKGCGAGLFEKEQDTSNTCINCSLSSNCGSNCIAVNEAMTGDPRKPDAICRVLAQIHTSNHLQHYSTVEMCDRSENDLSKNKGS